MFLGLLMLSAGITLVFLTMRAVMDIGGACASGGPYVIAQPCPDSVIALMPLGIFGGLIGVGLYSMAVSKLPGPHLALLSWSALFLSLGWNFWEYGLNPPDGSDSVVWGWIICGVVFVLMGGLPLLALASPQYARMILWADAPAPRTGVFQPVLPSATTWEPIVTAPVGPDDSVAVALERLAALRATGALTEEEFTLAKRRLLEAR